MLGMCAGQRWAKVITIKMTFDQNTWFRILIMIDRDQLTESSDQFRSNQINFSRSNINLNQFSKSLFHQYQFSSLFVITFSSISLFITFRNHFFIKISFHQNFLITFSSRSVFLKTSLSPFLLKIVMGIKKTFGNFDPQTKI